jgi:RNA-binding protein
MLTSKQRAYLRGLANKEETIFQIGKGGINDNLVVQVNDALEARELIKLRVLETAPVTAKEAAFELAEKTNSDSVQVIGSRFVLYKESKENKKIVFPNEKLGMRN